MKMRLACMAALGLAALSSNDSLVAQIIPPAMGPHLGFDAATYDGVPSFGPTDRVVMTHFFTWYDSASGRHLTNPDGTDALTTHPAVMKGYSYKLSSWHKAQLEDMMAAGIDIVLPVYWGAPSEQTPGSHHHWSFEGLEPLMEAMRELEREGKQPPRIGLFYDTSTLRHNTWGYHADLRTERGKEWFYASIRDFFSMIQPKYWALIDGKPVVVLYSSGFATGHDPSTLDHAKAAFVRDFGGREPYVIREVSWNIRAENVYAWGGAVKPNFLGVAEIGPGYDHSAVPGRDPLVTDRRGGRFYEEAWLQALRKQPRIVIIETWNEHHEGTDIAESREYGRQYINLTRKYADLFKAGWVPPPLAGPYSNALQVSIGLGTHDEVRGLERVEAEDGKTEPALVGGKECRQLSGGNGRARYLYLAIDESFKTGREMDVTVEVEYFDSDEAGSIRVQYDRDDPAAAFGGAYTSSVEVEQFAGSRAWKVARFSLARARFLGSQNQGADFRVASESSATALRRVTVKRLE